jgi:hypothetical protein
MAQTTLLDIAKMNGTDAEVGLIEEVTTVAPEVKVGAARTIKGMNYNTLVRTGLPTVNFRNANEGVVPSKSTWEKRLTECYILNPSWQADKAVADKHEDGAQALLALEADGMVKAAFIRLGLQFYYGNTVGLPGDIKGFPGLLQSYDATNMVVDAGGTSDNTASSVWAVKWGAQNVQFVYGADGSLDVSDPREQSVADPNNAGAFYTAYFQEMLAYPGLQVSNVYCIGRIKKLTAEAGKGLTDNLVSQLLEKFPVGFKPDVLLMGRRSLGQLQRSRTATNPTGAPAPIPTESQGIPIEVTDSIVNTEALSW